MVKLPMSRQLARTLPLLGATFLATALLATAHQPPKKVLGVLDNDKEIIVKRGEMITVRLPANPSTGYSWYFFSGNDPWKLKGRQYTQTPANPRLVGVGGEETFTFETTTPGTGYLRLISLRPADPKVRLENIWQVQIKVKN
jgi:inhibitor of cysteine peptidase